MSTKVLRFSGENYLLFDREIGRISVSYGMESKDDCLLIPVEAWLAMEESLFQMFGSDYHVIMRKAGEGAGNISARSFPIKDRTELTAAIEIGFNGTSRWGLGQYVLNELDRQEKCVVFELHHSALESHSDSDKYHRFIEEPYFLIGFYEGLFSSLFGEKMRCLISRITKDTRSYYKIKITPVGDSGSLAEHDKERSRQSPRTSVDTTAIRLR